MFHDECWENNSTKMCREFQILILNPFGEGNNCDQKIMYTNVALHFLKFYYLGECHCQNDLLEHYDDQSILHCYEEYTQGPCMEEQIFYQPVELDDNGAQKNPICIFI